MAETTTVTGIVHKVMETQQISDKFAKKEIVIKTDGDYPQYILVQFTQQKISLLDHTVTGQRVVIDYNLRGREYSKDGKTSYFLSCEGWRIKTDNVTFDKEAPPITAAKVIGNPVSNQADEELPF